jgi:3-deoxy-D-arabino-heptulosonate 7-phosphate (DAHP) synthase
MSATGMKQGRTVCEGASRQEGEKPWRRNEPGEASPGLVDLAHLMRWRGANLMRGTTILQHALWSPAGGQALKRTQLREWTPIDVVGGRRCVGSVRKREDLRIQERRVDGLGCGAERYREFQG